MYQDLLIDEDQGWLCRWFQCHGRPTEMKTQKLLTWSYDDGFPIIRENSRPLSFTKFWVFLPWQRRCHQSREVWWLWVGPEVFWNLEEQPSWNQQIEIFKTGQLENCHRCPFYHAEEGSAINKIVSILNCVACWFFCQKVLKISVQAILQTRCPLHLPLFPICIHWNNFPVFSFNTFPHLYPLE